MGKITGWKKQTDNNNLLSYRSLNYNNKYRKPIILMTTKINNKWMTTISVIEGMRDYRLVGTLNNKNTKSEAKEQLIKYMKAHPKG